MTACCLRSRLYSTCEENYQSKLIQVVKGEQYVLIKVPG